MGNIEQVGIRYPTSLRLSAAERAAFEQAAEVRKMTLGEWLRALGREATGLSPAQNMEIS